MYEVKSHKISDIWYKQTSNYSSGRTITPRFIVMHYTTGWSATSNRDYLLGKAGGRPESAVSAHIVIGRDGEIWQICTFDKRAWHAGPSRHGTVKDLNTHSVGIEFVNPGWLRDIGGGRFQDYHKKVLTEAELDARGGFVREAHPRVGSGVFAWPNYTDSQVESGKQVVAALIAKYEIQDIASHEEIDTRDWKTDPGPAFPMQTFTDMLGTEIEDISVFYTVTASRLFVRAGPGAEFEPMDPPEKIPFGTQVERLDVNGDWFFVEPSGNSAHRGWVHSDYLARIW